MYVSHVCVPDVQEGQKRVLDFLELELVMGQHVDSEQLFRFSLHI